MAQRKVTSGPSDTNSSTSTFIFVDNVSVVAGESLSGAKANTQYFSAASFSLPPNTPDPLWFNSFASTIKAAGTSGIVVTSDRGKGDGVMRQIISQQNARVCVITTSITGEQDQATAFSLLPTVDGFKDISKYGERYPKIHLSKGGKDLIVNYKDTKGRQVKNKVKTIRNAFKLG